MQFTPGDSAFLASHGSGRNPRLCATCHVERFTVRDTLTKAFQLQVVGHSFLATPCVNANGIPTGATTCPRAERRYESCASAGCHSSAANARGLHSLAESRIDPLVVQLDALLARIPATEFSSTDGRYTTAEGSKFNSTLAKSAGAEVHNPFLVEALLRASIEQIRRDYGLTPTVPVPAASAAMESMLAEAWHRTAYRPAESMKR
jgi:hypothetical protein